ncbi:MAG: thiamine pyrophosphate-dependent dehydrogenase E1 component subunit alpha [Eubacteriales bacterium]
MTQDLQLEKMKDMYKKMYLIRKYEERIYYLFLEGIMPGSIHQSHGQEACAVGMLYDLRKEDYMASTHRPAGHDLAKGVSLNSMMCEMFAKSNGCCKGKGGAMHTGDIDVGAIPANAIVGGNIPIAAGIGLALKLQKKNDVVICFFGDGASNEGSFHEGLNGAAIWNLPVIYVCENNLYGASTSFTQSSKIKDIAQRAASYGMPGITVDGNDVLAVNEAANTAIERARKGEGPTLIELKTYRIAGHSRSDACAYRDKNEEKEWFAKDPIARFKKVLLERGISEEDLKNIEKEVENEIEQAVDFALSSPDPMKEDALCDVY